VRYTDQVTELLNCAFESEDEIGRTHALVVIRGGQIIHQEYGGQLEFFDRPPQVIGSDTKLLSWSTAKSILHAVVGLLVMDGAIDINAKASVPYWGEDGDPRSEITVEQLLGMVDGLDFVENYVDARASDVIEMLFGSGADDMAAFAAHRELAALPGARFNYSSGTTNIISAIVSRAVGPGEPYRRFVHDRLFSKIGMRSPELTFDAAGTWVASSYLHATALDFARFGYLYLRDGIWDGERILPPGWVDNARIPRSRDSETGYLYGAHWWVDEDELGTFRASGYEGQMIVVSPGLDLVFVRLGKTPENHKQNLDRWRTDLIRALSDQFS